MVTSLSGSYFETAALDYISNFRNESEISEPEKGFLDRVSDSSGILLRNFD